MQFNSVKPSFAGAYSKVMDDWYDLKEGKKVSFNEVKADYESSKDKQAYVLNAKDIIANFGFLIQTSICNQQLVLTDKDANQFKDASKTEQVLMTNKWFEPLYKFNNSLEAEPVSNLELLG